MQDHLAKSEHRLVERSASNSLPRSQAVTAAALHIQQHCGVFQEPWDQSMADRDNLPDPSLQAQLDRPEEAPDEHCSDFCAAIRLRIVLWGRL